jgi:RNA binding exosome subunit
MEDFDVREFAKMFDAALASDNLAVKKALRNFMMIAAIVHAQEEGEERLMGPLETLVKKVCDLERIVYDLQRNKEYDRDYYKGLYGNQTWVTSGYNPNTSATSGTTWKDSIGYTAQDLIELMKDLKIK